MAIDINNFPTYVKVGFVSTIVRSVAYLGRSVLPITPQTAQIFYISHTISNAVCYWLRDKLETGYPKLASVMNFTGRFLPVTLTVATKILSPVQAITALGLGAISTEIYILIRDLIRYN